MFDQRPLSQTFKSLLCLAALFVALLGLAPLAARADDTSSDSSNTQPTTTEDPKMFSTSVGEDQGIALTLVDRWQGDQRKAFRVNQGVSYYFSATKVNEGRLRFVGSVNLLDFDDKEDFEVGLGVGFLIRELGNLKGQNSSLGLVGGVGLNLMTDDHDKAWYSFIGFSMNFQDGTKEAEHKAALHPNQVKNN